MAALFALTLFLMAFSQGACNNQPFDVFISCRGEYTGMNFTNGLYSGFIQAQFRISGEHNGIPAGGNTGWHWLVTKKAINESKVSVIVFSNEHAASRRCLDELVLIVERRGIDGHVVIPIFYHVNPTDVLELTGAYGAAFAKNVKMLKGKMDNRVEAWKTALKEVVNVKGLNINNRIESEFIQHIVQVIMDISNPKVPDVAFHFLQAMACLPWIILLVFILRMRRLIYALRTWATIAVNAACMETYSRYHELILEGEICASHSH